MKQDIIAKLHKDFEAICHHNEEIGNEFWLARELQGPLPSGAVILRAAPV